LRARSVEGPDGNRLNPDLRQGFRRTVRFPESLSEFTLVAGAVKVVSEVIYEAILRTNK